MGQRDVRNEVLALGFDLERHHERVMAGLAEGRAEHVWQRIGLDGPLERESARAWIAGHMTTQRVAGDRLRLRLPRSLMPDEPRYWKNPSEAWPYAHDQGEPHPVRIWFHTPYGGEVETWTGRYLERDLEEYRRHWLGSYEARDVQPLARVAIASRLVAYQTGCHEAEASAWLLCDDPIPARPIVARFHTAIPGGVFIWVPDWQISAEDLSKLYARQRAWLTKSRQRSRRTEERLDALIEYVERSRPYEGRHKENTTWADMLEEWNNAEPDPRFRYKNVASMQGAYKAAREVREKRGILPRRETGE